MSRFAYCLVYCIAVRAYYSLGALDKVEGEQYGSIICFLLLLIGATVTPLSANEHLETLPE